ncbi:hypothetical protein SARC_04231 [Sphaeroforma arctica JP610]|uniref:Uncharacterized protein n=1 Tax=Sphaeroforma arctica JP610 TaxID=667725 RepID=A0A0L0G376_9EUKA|nr:hypothetical protein SARC_04231 [Sphaeroforma arctica JP610]KNC83530.1 hypothetical protein SARC_04231 [Sphaeroforma arctica JP610]|eukprot:XP_014157432.1 hypothetical protein SARC_04231 [Sphaeroforma arctica JP610]
MDDITSVVQQVLAEHEKLITGIQDNGLSNINVADMGSTPTDNVEAMVKAVRTATDASNKDIQSVTSRLSRANTLLAKPIIPST